MFSTTWLLLLCLFQNFLYVYGWGVIGHSIIVRLAQSQLKDSASEWITSLTPWHWNGNLSAMASWADDIIYSNSNPTGSDNWQWTRELHYGDIPDWNCSYQAEKDCINDRCVAGSIKNYTKRLETEFDDIQLKEALYFLIHFVGDIHQPLHSGFKTDRGGNDVEGSYMNTNSTNLHSLWDQGLIATRVRRNFQSNNSLYYEYIHELMINQTVVDNDDNIEQWIKENIDIVCKQIYFDEQNETMNSSVRFSLGETYYQRSIPVIEQRLAHGGRRLGALLNSIAKNRLQKPSDKTKKLCSGTIALIAVLAAECLVGIIIGIILWIRFKNKSSKAH